MDIEKAKKFLSMMVAKGKLTQEEADAKLAKHETKEAVKVKYKKDKAKLNKAELQELLDTLTG